MCADLYKVRLDFSGAKSEEYNIVAGNEKHACLLALEHLVKCEEYMQADKELTKVSAQLVVCFYHDLCQSNWHDIWEAVDSEITSSLSSIKQNEVV